MPELDVFFYVLLFVVAFMYASVGHGGASGYLALMSLFSFTPEVMRPTALILNIAVSFIAFLQYYQAVNFRWKLFLSLAILAIPAAFIGGTISLQSSVYKQILAIVLLFSIIRLWQGKQEEKSNEIKEFNWIFALLMGAGIGLLSGMVGIGGGIILSPILLLLGWSNLKETAAISAIFITVNSVAGLAGKAYVGFSANNSLLLLAGVAIIGGTAGSFLGARHFNNLVIRQMLIVVLLFAAAKLWFVK
jgi:uncharacterized membrane protein YfcA